MKATLLIILAAASLSAQTAATDCAMISPSAAKLEFDAASIKPADSSQSRIVGRISGGPGTSDLGRVTAMRITLANLIYHAYALMNDQLTGPDWMKDPDQYSFAITATMPPRTTKEEYCGMLRNLLVSRFHLASHIEHQPRPAWELTILPRGPKFRKYEPAASDLSLAPDPAAGINRDARGYAVLPPGAPTGLVSGFSPNGMVRLTFRNAMDALARQLGYYINISDGVPNSAPIPRVIDKTGLEGIYDIHLEFAGPPRIPAPDTPPPDPADVGANVFIALQQQLGLRLQKVKDVTVDVLIVEHADQTPAEN